MSQQAAVPEQGAGRPQPLLSRLHAKVDVVYREVVKFGAVGAVAFVVDIGVFNLLRSGVLLGHLADKPLTAKTLSVFAATIVAWMGNRYWTFRRRRRASRRREFVLFALMNVAGLLIALSCLGFSHYVLGLDSALADNISGNVVGLILGTLFRFWAYRTFVFTEAAEKIGDAVERVDAAVVHLVEDVRDHVHLGHGQPHGHAAAPVPGAHGPAQAAAHPGHGPGHAQHPGHAHGHPALHPHHRVQTGTRGPGHREPVTVDLSTGEIPVRKG